ncbi:MAG: aminoacetone oxidase family FAD-binding enzyme, partial [Bacteroidota bacterium]
QTIIDCLLKEAEKYQVQVMMHTEVVSLDSFVVSHEPLDGSPTSSGVDRALADSNKADRQFKLEVSISGSTDYRLLTTDFLCVASGGYPKAVMFHWLKKTGHTIDDPVPSLFTFNMPGNALNSLMGISVENATVRIAGTKLESGGPLLITHWGLSGPAILKLSAWGARDLAACNYAFTAIVNWFPGYNEQTLRERFVQLRFDMAAQKMVNKNPFALPARLWEYFLGQSGIKEETRWADLPAALQNKLVKILCAQDCPVKGKTTFKEEFVTAGGVKLGEIDANTMMSKLLPGLFFAGEILNVDGVTGGFNFQHAWTSGWIAAKTISQGW